MNEPVDETEGLAKAILEILGCIVKKIPESPKKTPDFHVEYGSDRFLIEHEYRRDVIENARRQKEVGSKGNVFQWYQPIEKILFQEKSTRLISSLRLGSMNWIRIA